MEFELIILELIADGGLVAQGRREMYDGRGGVEYLVRSNEGVLLGVVRLSAGEVKMMRSTHSTVVLGSGSTSVLLAEQGSVETIAGWLESLISKQRGRRGI